MHATTGGASSSRPKPLTKRQQHIVKLARRSVVAKPEEIPRIAKAYRRMNLTPSEQRLANRAASQHGAHLRKLQGSNFHNFVSDAQKISQGLLDTAGLHGAAHPIARLQHPGGELMFPGFGKNPARLLERFRPNAAMQPAERGTAGASASERVSSGNLKRRMTQRLPQDMTPEVQSTAGKVTGALSFGGAKKARIAQDIAHSKERARRAEAADKAMREHPGIEGYYKAKHELRGQLPKHEFGALKDVLTPEEIQGLHTHISNHNGILPLSKVSTHRALTKLTEGEVPTNYERGLLYKAFGPEYVKHLEASMGLGETGNKLLEVANVPRSLMASADISGGLRQGLVAAARHPGMFAKNYPLQFKHAFSEDIHQADIAALHKHPDFADAVQHGVKFTELGPMAKREEALPSNLAERIPGIGHIVRGSGRAYVGFLDKMRMDMWEHHVVNAEKFYGQALTRKQKENIAGLINNATGRGSLGRFERDAVTLNTLFFSPRLLASRLNLLNPVYYAKLDPYARRQALRSMAHLVAFVGGILYTAHLAGARVTLDPRNSDWGKIRIGNTRIDLLGGFQQPIRLFAQELSGESVSSTTGQLKHLGPGFGNTTRGDVLTRFIEGKFAPIPSVIADQQRGQDFQGNPFSVGGELKSHLLPLSIQDAKDLYHDRGSLPAAVGAYAVGATGVGIQTYAARDSAKKKYQAHLKEVNAAVRQIGGVRIPKEIRGRLQLRLERAEARQKESDGLVADVNVIAAHHWMTPGEAAHAREWLKTASKHDRASFGQELRHRFFDRPGDMTLTGFYKWLRENGADIEQFSLGGGR